MLALLVVVVVIFILGYLFIQETNKQRRVNYNHAKGKHILGGWDDTSYVRREGGREKSWSVDRPCFVCSSVRKMVRWERESFCLPATTEVNIPPFTLYMEDYGSVHKAISPRADDPSCKTYPLIWLTIFTISKHWYLPFSRKLMHISVFHNLVAKTWTRTDKQSLNAGTLLLREDK